MRTVRAIGKHLAPSVLGLLALSSALHAGYPMIVRDARGARVVISARPMRIVSLTPSNTEILFALGLGDRIVGITRYCNYPPAARKKTRVGDMTTSAEAVVALKPDLIVAHATLNSAATRRLEKVGLRVFAIDPKTLSDVARDIRTLGRITARPRTAASVAAKMERAIAQVRASRAHKSWLNVLVVVQANPLWAAGPKTFVDEMLRIANARNIAFDARPGFNTFSRELAISRNPDVIIVGNRADSEFFRKSSLWKTCGAVKNGRVYVFDSDLLFRPGPRLALGLAKLAESLSANPHKAP